MTRAKAVIESMEEKTAGVFQKHPECRIEDGEASIFLVAALSTALIQTAKSFGITEKEFVEIMHKEWEDIGVGPSN